LRARIGLEQAESRQVAAYNLAYNAII
jgi:hypothetical protein